MISVKVEGQEEVKKAIEKAAKKSYEETVKGVELACQVVQKKAKQKAPVDLGDLSANIIYETNKLQGTVGVDNRIKYAAYVEFGTRPHLAPVGEGWMKRHGFTGSWIYVSGKAQPFLLPALYDSKSEIIRIFRDIMKGVKL